MRKLRRTAAALGLLLPASFVSGAGTAVACGNGKPIFRDKFQTLAESWAFSSSSDRANAGPGGLTAVIPTEHGVFARKVDASYGDIDICAMTAIASKGGTDAFFAIRFWFGEASESYWAVAVPANGLYWVQRFNKEGERSRITPRISNPTLADASGVNELRVRLEGDNGAFIVNGKKVATFTREPGRGKSIVGFSAFSADSPEPTSFTLKSFEARELGNDRVPAAPSLIGICNEFKQTLRVAIAYQAGNVWTSEGWKVLRPNTCETEIKHPDLVSFYYRAESDVYDGQQITFGAIRDFAVRKSDFLIQQADRKAQDTEMRKFSGPVGRVSPAQNLSIVFQADARVAIVTGPKPE